MKNAKVPTFPKSSDFGSDFGSDFRYASRNQYFAIRLKKAREKNGLKQHELAKKIGVSKTTIQNYEYGKPPKVETVALIADALGCTIEWLMDGDGQASGNAEPSPAYGHPMDAFALVPKSKARLNAGGGNVVYDERVAERYAFRKDWLNQVATAQGNVVLLDVDGDSMSPTLPDRCTVLIDTGRRDPQNGYIYAIGTDDVIQVKRLALLPGAIRVISDNRSAGYETYDVHAGDLRVIGRVIWVGINL